MAEEEYKKRRILERDFDTVEAFIKEEMEARAKNPFRTKHESRWKEVDRQIAMDPMQKFSPDGRTIKGDWQSALELGELSKASEIITADVMRIVFANENWLEPHVQIEGLMNPQTGQYQIPEGEQERQDGLLRALMIQQHKDFGLKNRVKLSVKEALHHGSFVAEVRWDQQMMAQGAKIRTIGAPVWQPYSMWNAYPDPSPSVIGTNLFYSGDMILVEYIPLHKLKRMRGEGWLHNRIKLVKKEEHKDKDNETKDVKLVKWYGDICIERSDGDIYLPNMKVILANGKLVFAKPNELPHSPIIFAGYERQDVRDPYYTSPIIKQSPTHKFTTVMANEFIDAVKVRTKPPVEYDGNDPDYVANGGPDLSPGSKNPTKSMGKGFKSLEVGDPNAALSGMQFGIRQLQEGLGVSSLRQGTDTSDRQTATEAKIMEQGSEVRTIDFIGELESQGLRPWLYMQHGLNRLNLTEYLAYSNELNTPDVVRFTKKDIDVDVHFDVVGAKGILGEQQRQQQTSNVTVFASGNPLFAPLIKPERILIDMYRDAGKKNPEEWVRTQGEGQKIPPEIKAQMQQMTQAMQAMKAELDKAKSGEEIQLRKIELDRAKAEADFSIEKARLEMDKAKAMQEMKIDAQEVVQKANAAIASLEIDRQAMIEKYELEAQKIRNDFALKAKELELQREKEKEEMRIKEEAAKAKASQPVKIKRTKDGYEVNGKTFRRTKEGFEAA